MNLYDRYLPTKKDVELKEDPKKEKRERPIRIPRIKDSGFHNSPFERALENVKIK